MQAMSYIYLMAQAQMVHIIRYVHVYDCDSYRVRVHSTRVVYQLSVVNVCIKGKENLQTFTAFKRGV